MEAMEQVEEQGHDHNPLLKDCIRSYTHIANVKGVLYITHINIVYFVQTMHLVHKSYNN